MRNESTHEKQTWSRTACGSIENDSMTAPYRWPHPEGTNDATGPVRGRQF